MNRHTHILTRLQFIPVTLIIICLNGFCNNLFAQGTWSPVTNVPPNANAGVTLLLSDGTIMAKNLYGSFYGMGWDKLTPDNTGSYINGAWSDISPMSADRLYFSTQVLKTGQVYVAGGEYGSGYGTGEVYDPVYDSWTPIPSLTGADSFYDANSKILPDGKVLQATICYTTNYRGTYIYDPVTNTYSNGPSCIGLHDETTWLKLPDGSILLADWFSTTSERYIPSLNTWIPDASLPVSIYDTIAEETGAAVMLPNGKAFFMGGNGNTVFYTPSGTTAPGTWTTGPKIPNNQGAPDAPASIMPNGKVLLVTSPVPHDSDYFPTPTSFYEFDYLTDSFTQIPSPYGTDTISIPPFYTHMLNLPDGNILFSIYYSDQYFIYTPGGSVIAAGHPSVDSIFKVSCDTYQITGTQFNGISEGSSYGDDWQMATNYPIVRLTSGSNVYYARTYNWNSTGLCTGSLPDTSMFVLPPGLPSGTYSLEVTVNGIASLPVSFTTCPAAGVANVAPSAAGIFVHPNPANDRTVVSFDSKYGGQYTVRLSDMVGQIITEENGIATPGVNNYTLHFDAVAKGMYIISVQQADKVYQAKIVVE